jgi:tetratricopeptide (TPR) repeat protein
MTYKIVIFAVLILLSNPVLAIQSGGIEYDDVFTDYSLLNAAQIRSEADAFFAKEDYDAAMGKYYLLTKIDSSQAFALVQLARIYDQKNKNRLAKEYFYRATNIDPNDPYATFYFGEFYFKRDDFKRALRYYKIAYGHGFSDRYDINLRLATVYEKLADLVSAQKYYAFASRTNPELQEKVNSINALNYDKSEYYHFIRE